MKTVPLSFGPLRNADGNARITGPCGDTMEFWVRLDEAKIALASFTTDGCNHSLRCGEAMASLACGLPLKQVATLDPADILEIAGSIPDDSAHCATLALDTLRAALDGAANAQECNSDCTTCDHEACTDRASVSPKVADVEPASTVTVSLPMTRIKHKIVVLSGKGGVGKSTIAVNTASTLALQGKRVGLLDIDLHGPSIPTMFGLQNSTVESNGLYILPVVIPELNNMKIFSIGFMLKNLDDAVIWRGPMKAGAIKQFLQEVDWGELDYLVVDCPPGTGDEQLAIIQELGDPEGAIIVTTPQEVAAADVRKSINFCKQLKLPVIGIVENMSGFVCPACGTTTDIFHAGGGEAIADQYRIPFLGRIPLDPAIGRACDEGQAFVQRHAITPNAEVFNKIIRFLEYRQEITTDYSDSLKSPTKSGHDQSIAIQEKKFMKVAIPVANGLLNQHFGHCDQLVVYTVDLAQKSFSNPETLTPPPHEPGLLPRWLDERGIKLVIAGGMGQKAQELFTERGIQVITGAPCLKPVELVRQHLDGTLKTGENGCDH